MEPQENGGVDGARCFLETPPLQETKRLAETYGCDIAIPNIAGIGNILMYTRVVEDLARRIGRPLNILTSRLCPPIGLSCEDDAYSIWSNNPFVGTIVDAEFIDPAIMKPINAEMDNLCQFSHMIENIAYHYGVRPRCLRPSLYLSREEQDWALNRLSALPRPIVSLHPHGTSSPRAGHPWYEANWKRLIARVEGRVTVLELFKSDCETKNLHTMKFETTLRQMMALVWASDLFVGFDSSVAHIATAFSIPSIVLWDPFRKLHIEERWQAGFAPAALSRWSYPQNRNLIVLGERDDEIVEIVVAWINDSVRSFCT